MATNSLWVKNVEIPTSSHPEIKKLKRKTKVHNLHGNKIWDSSMVIIESLDEMDIINNKILDGKLNLNHEISGAIIYGAGNAGKQVCDLILKKNINGVYCFIDDDEKKIGKYYKNKPIISKISLEKISNSTVIPNIIIAIPSLNNEKLQKLFK